MPTALCGVVGFKPTAGRLSNSGCASMTHPQRQISQPAKRISRQNSQSRHCSRLLPLNWTVGMPGILAATVEDALIASVPPPHSSPNAHHKTKTNLLLLHMKKY